MEEKPDDTTVEDDVSIEAEPQLSESLPKLWDLNPEDDSSEDARHRPSGLRSGHHDSEYTWPKPGLLLASRFRFQKLLGSGSNGAVWQAVNTLLGVKVAIKLPNADKMTPRDLERFRREARALCLIHNEHVLRFFEYNTEPTPYLAMELLRGHDLAEHIEKHGPLPLPAVKAVCKQLCAGLQAVHDAGIIHRDIKPANIYCLGDPEIADPGKVKLVDFGLMKLINADTDSSLDSTQSPMRELTEVGSLLGTPKYMSPEQWSSTQKGPSFPSDLWSLGVVLYKLLTGEVPFNRKTQLALARAVTYEQAPDPSKLLLNLPLDVDLFFRKALHKDPGKRFASAAEMGKAFEAIPDRLPDPVEKGGRRRRAAIAAGTMAGLLAMIISAAVFLRWYRPPECAMGTRDCDGNAANRCETNLLESHNCGGCGVSCVNEHGTTTCAAAICTPTCEVGFGDCDGNPVNGCEVDLRSSIGHCGACGHACNSTNGTAYCDENACSIACRPGFGNCDADAANGCEEDFNAVQNPTKMCSPVKLASGEWGAVAIAVDEQPDGNVYWTNRSTRTVKGMTKSGRALTTLWRGGAGDSIVVGRKYVLWRDSDTSNVLMYRRIGGLVETLAEHKLPKQLCEPLGLSTHEDRTYWIVHCDTYWTLWVDNNIKKHILLDDSLGIAINGLAADSFGIYWATVAKPNRGLWMLNAEKPSKPQQLLSTTNEPSALAVDPRGDYIYWTERGSERSFQDGTISRMQVSSSQLKRQDLALGEKDPKYISVDQEWVYWSTADGAVKKIRKDGTGTTVPLVPGMGSPVAIATDKQYVFMANSKTGEIRKLAK